MNRKDFLKAGLVMIGGVWVPKQQGATIIVRGPRIAAAGGPSPIGWLKFNEGSGTSAADDSGNSNTGTLTGGATWTTGPNSNGAVALDGTDDYVAVANEANFDFERTDAFSFSFWFRWNSSETGVPGIITKQDTGGNQAGIQIDLDTTNSWVRVYLVNAGGSSIGGGDTTHTVTSSTWHHVVITYDGSSTGAGFKVYVNNASPHSYSGTLTGSILNDNPLWIGRGNNGYLWGDIDDVRVYDVELTSGQVSTIYTAGAQ